VTCRSQVWLGTGVPTQNWLRQFPLRIDYGRSPHAYVNQRLQIQSSWWWAVCRSKHVEPLMNGGIINSITRLHLVGYLSWIILRCTDPWILNLKMKTVGCSELLVHLFSSNKSPTRCNNFPVYYPDVYLQLNMFRAFPRASSGAQWLQ
jgi:hypothetical protein